MEGTEDFFKVYSSLPIDERENVVVVINKEPISWNLAYHEIKNKTKNGEIILKKLKELEII
jgi:hypothetical protein